MLCNTAFSDDDNIFKLFECLILDERCVCELFDILECIFDETLQISYNDITRT
jgi:hypothetical protein